MTKRRIIVPNTMISINDVIMSINITIGLFSGLGGTIEAGAELGCRMAAEEAARFGRSGRGGVFNVELDDEDDDVDEDATGDTGGTIGDAGADCVSNTRCGVDEALEFDFAVDDVSGVGTGAAEDEAGRSLEGSRIWSSSGTSARETVSFSSSGGKAVMH